MKIIRVFLTILISVFISHLYAQEADITFTVRKAHYEPPVLPAHCLTSFTPDTIILRGLSAIQDSVSVRFDKGSVEIHDSLCIITPYQVRNGIQAWRKKPRGLLLHLFGGWIFYPPTGQRDSSRFYIYRKRYDPYSSGPLFQAKLCIEPQANDVIKIYWGGRRMYNDNITKLSPAQARRLLSKAFSYANAAGKKHLSFQAVSIEVEDGKTGRDEPAMNVGSSANTKMAQQFLSDLKAAEARQKSFKEARDLDGHLSINSFPMIMEFKVMLYMQAYDETKMQDQNVRFLVFKVQ